jgi:nicotinamidase/pyrazinamidase
MNQDTIFWDVDTQFDFMRPTGRLYVPGAERIIDTVSGIRRLALTNGFSIVADVDWHSLSNPDISDQPDFQTILPPHCVAGEPGSERVGYLGDVPIDYVQIKDVTMDHLRKLVAKDQFHLVLRKDTVDMFEYPRTDELLDLIRPKHAAVFGVALDFCVYYVLRGLAAHREIEVFLLKDAAQGLGTRPPEEIYREVEQMGVHVTTSEAFERDVLSVTAGV